MDHRDIIRDYFDCFRHRDRARVEDLLAPDLVHESPWKRYDNAREMLDEIWPNVGKVWAVDIEIFGEGPGYMVRYRHSEGSARLAEYFRFESDRIAEIVVYPGPEA